MDVVGGLASITALATLAYQVSKKLNDFIQRFAAAPDCLRVLRSKVYAFAAALERLHRYLKAAEKNSTLRRSQIREVQGTIEGGKIIIDQLNNLLAGVQAETPRHANQKVKMTPLDRILFNFDEDRITRWSTELSEYCGPLLLLLESQKLDQGTTDDFFAEANDEGSDTQSTNMEALVDDMALLEATEKAVPMEEWVRRGNSFELDRGQTEAKESGLKFQNQMVDGRIELRQQYRQLLSTGSQTFSGWQLRIALLGRSGSGKSKLSSFVCGLPYLDDSFDGNKTLPEQIWTPVNNEKRRELAIHDSGGLEGPETISVVKQFMAAKQKNPKLQDQVHAIWYMIPCSDPKRAVQEIDKFFLSGKLFDTGQIPIFVVYTQYDLLHEYVRKRLGKQAEEKDVQQKTYEIFKEQIESVALASIKDKSMYSFCRVGIDEDGREYTADDGGPPFGLDNLTKQIESRLRNGYLQIQWVAIQQRDDRSKLYNSISSSIASLWTARAVAKSSYIPGVCVVGIAAIWGSILNTAARFWEIIDWRGSLSTKVLRAIFDDDKRGLTLQINLLFLDMIGPLTLSLVSKITLRMIVGVNLIGRRLFRRRAVNDNVPLSQEQIDAEILNFQNSSDRQRMANVITAKRMAKIDYKKANRVDEVMQVAREALEASVGYVDESFFNEEHMRVSKEHSAVGVS